MKEKEYNIIVKLLFIFVLLQPLLDILSTLANMNYIINISTYLKPLFVFGITFYLLFKNPNRKKWIIYIITFVIYMFIHLLLIYNLVIFNSVILQELRFILNIAYMIALFISFNTLYCYSYDKSKLLSNMKKCLLYTFIIYTGLFILSIITKTSFLTYSYSDPSKLGYRGWYFSGQIFGHALSVVFPISLYTILKPEKNIFQKIIFILFFVITACLLGTKVPYYIVLAVLILYIIIYALIKVFNKDFKRYRDNILIVLFFAIAMFSAYNYTPVHYNTEINKSNYNNASTDYNLNEMSGLANFSEFDKIREEYPNSDLRETFRFLEWNQKASNILKDKMENKEIHPSENRKKQFLYNKEMFMNATFKYKLFGTGFLNQVTSIFAIEGDFFMALFNFGLIGFILFLFIPIYYFIKTTIFILKNINFCIDGKKKISIVGENGAGKSTFIKLLMRLYDPTEGQITLNGIDIKKINIQDYYDLFSVVFQDYQLIGFSLGEQITSSDHFNEEKVNQILKDVQFENKMEHLEKGLATSMLKYFDNQGIELSGGESQKIAIARSLYKNGKILILDEPTSALDPLAEYEIYSQFHKMTEGKLTFYISHRLSSCRFCDEIIVLEQGKIVQVGHHDTLIQDEQGKYYKMFKAQAKYYQDDQVKHILKGTNFITK